MITVIIVFILLIIITICIYFKLSSKKINEILNNNELDKVCSNLPNNINICSEIIQKMKIENIEIEANTDKNSKTSYYSSITKKIFLCDSEDAKKSFARVLFISHECVHAKQNKLFLNFNLILSLINVLYTAIVIGIIIFMSLPETILLCILIVSIILNMFSYFARNVIESDASYSAILVAKDYLKNHILEKDVERIINEYLRIISFGFSTFQLSLFKNNLLSILILMLAIIIKLV